MRRILNSNRGAAAIEMSLILPLLFVILFGIIEFSALFYNKAVITNASREGARYAAGFYTNPANANSTRPKCSHIQDYVVHYVNKYFINFTSSTPFSTGNVSCPNTNPYINYGGYEGYVDTIRVQYDYGFLVFGKLLALLPGSVPATVTLKSETSMRDENQS